MTATAKSKKPSKLTGTRPDSRVRRTIRRADDQRGKNYVGQEIRLSHYLPPDQSIRLDFVAEVTSEENGHWISAEVLSSHLYNINNFERAKGRR